MLVDNMKEIPFVYVPGMERTANKECGNYKQSIFSEQYGHALQVAGSYLHFPVSDALQAIAFSGDRGEGKSSAMLSFAHLLEHAKDNESFLKDKIGSDDIVKDITECKFLTLEAIDPSFFNNEYNILEYFTGALYNKVGRRSEIPLSGADEAVYNDVLISFQRVKNAISMLNHHREDLYDPLDEIGSMASGMMLRSEIKLLVRNVLKLTKKDRLVVMIDDIDLNMNGAYSMAEYIRQYLCMEELILLVAVNISQLRTAIATSINKNFAEQSGLGTSEEAEDMARKYVDKFLPSGCRATMPTLDRIFERPIIICNKENPENVIYQNPLLKDGIVELIFVKTRYLFYNSKGGANKIIPENLRLLNQLLALLTTMPLPGDKEDALRANQHEFRNYFFKTWTQLLPASARDIFKGWLTAPLDNNLNRNIATFLDDSYDLKDYLSKDYHSILEEVDVETKDAKSGNNFYEYDGLISSVLNSSNFSYNISAGDIFHVISCLEKDSLNREGENILFFIKSLYSMKLYENYDVVTESKDNIYPEDTGSRGIYRSDERFLHTNMLQRMVNGSYFTYTPGDLIAYTDTPRDMRVVLGYRYDKQIDAENDSHLGLSNLIHELKKEWPNFQQLSEEKKKQFNLKLKTVEFFMLTISGSISSKNRKSLKNADYIEKYLDSARKNVEPFYYSKFNLQTGYYIFNVMAPFANLLNVEYCYNRFYDGEDIFNIAISNPESLLYSMVKDAKTGRGEDPGVVEDSIAQFINNELANNDKELRQKNLRDFFYSNYYTLLSDAAIRNSEILDALTEDVTVARNDRSKMVTTNKGFADILSIFYKKTIYTDKDAMSTHRMNLSHNADTHSIKFNFLQSLIDYLDAVTEDTDFRKLFEQIYNPSFGLSDFDFNVRLFYICHLLPEKDQKYTKTQFIKTIIDEIPTVEKYFRRFRLDNRKIAKKTPMEWYSLLYKNKELIEPVLDNMEFDDYMQKETTNLFSDAIEQLLTPKVAKVVEITED